MKINIYKFFYNFITKTNNPNVFDRELLKMALYLHEELILKNVSLSSKLPTFECACIPNNNSVIFTTNSCFLHIFPSCIELSNLNEDGSISVYQYGEEGVYTNIHKYLFDKEYLEYNKFSEDSYKTIDKLIDSMNNSLLLPEINLSYRLSPFCSRVRIFKDGEEIFNYETECSKRSVFDLFIEAEDKMQSLENVKVKHLIK